MCEEFEKKAIRVAKRKKIIKDKGLKYKDLGIPAVISDVINEKRATKKIQKKIARRLGYKISDLWGKSTRISGNSI